MTDVSDRFKNIVVDHLGCDPVIITDTASFIDDLGADSLDRIELIMAAEDKFSTEISDDVAEQIVTFGDAVRAIQNSMLTKARP